MQAAMMAEAPSLKPKTPARASMTGQLRAALDGRRRRYTHDGSLRAGPASPSNFDADASAVFGTSKGLPGSTRNHPRPETHPDLAPDLGNVYDFSRSERSSSGAGSSSLTQTLPSTYGRPLGLGSNVTMSRPDNGGLASSLGAQHTIARHAEIKSMVGGTHLPMYGSG